MRKYGFPTTPMVIAFLLEPLLERSFRRSLIIADGSYLVFAYQEISETNKIQIYVIRYGDIGTGATFTPIPLPEDFFPNRTESPQPVLRQALNGQ